LAESITVKLTSKGQVTIPQAFREKFGLLPETEVTFEEVDGGVLIKPAAASRRRQAENWLNRARGSATTRLSTKDIMSLTRGEK
jgi:AbrB family looped-hinge helix DNA binding protein